MSDFKPGDRVMTQKGDRYRQPEAKFDIWEIVEEAKPFRQHKAWRCTKLFHAVKVEGRHVLKAGIRPLAPLPPQTLLEKNLIHYKGELPPFVKSFL